MVCVADNLCVKHYGEILKQLREEALMTQDELALQSGLSRSSIQNAEKSEKPSLKASSLKAIARALGVSLEEIDAIWRGEGKARLPTVGGAMSLLSKADREAAEALFEKWGDARVVIAGAVGLLLDADQRRFITEDAREEAGLQATARMVEALMVLRGENPDKRGSPKPDGRGTSGDDPATGAA